MTTDADAARWDDDVPFSCRQEAIEEGSVLVTAAGELDLHTCSEFQGVLAAARDRRPARLVVDLSDVTFIDSTALAVLVVVQRGMQRPLDVVVTRPHLRRILIVTGLDTVFVLHRSVEEACRRAA
jgi:anti-sigma B factor antagonist